MRVLVVDEGYVYRVILTALVSETPGFEVVGVASSAREVFDLLDSTNPQLILLDMESPELDGIETARRMRRMNPDVVVLLLTESAWTLTDDPFLMIEKKGELTPDGLAAFWHLHGRSR